MTELKRILYVEDDPDIQAIGVLSLETVGGFEIKTADSGPQALNALKTYMPQMVLLDVMMPGQDGPATLQAMREEDATKHLPVIFLTAKVQKHETESYIRQGAIGVITKPFDPMKLPDIIRQLWKAYAKDKPQ